MALNGLDKYESMMLSDLQTVQHEGLPLITLCIENYVGRDLTDEQTLKALEALVYKGLIVLPDYFFSRPAVCFDRIILAHYQSLHESHSTPTH